jgi:hypothetical protein
MEPIHRSFILKLILISTLGCLVANQDFTYQHSHLKQLLEKVHGSFLVFMQVILSKFSEEMFSGNFWARSMQQIVRMKQGRQPGVSSSGGSVELGSFRDQMISNNKEAKKCLSSLLTGIWSQRFDNNQYNQQLFKVCLELTKSSA